MKEPLQNKEIVQFLEDTKFSAGLFDTLKVKYRTYICPFIDLIGLVQPGDKVGDVGCGSGQFLLLVQRFANQPSSLFGIEITDRLIQNAQQLFEKHHTLPHQFMVYDGENFPEELADMDIIFLIDVLHHVPAAKQESFLRNLSEKVKPGGRLILKDINAASPLVYVNKLHDLIFAREIGNEISMERATSLLQKNGFEILQQSKRRMYVYPHYTLVALKK